MNLPVYSRGSKVAKEWCRECSTYHSLDECPGYQDRLLDYDYGTEALLEMLKEQQAVESRRVG